MIILNFCRSRVNTNEEVDMVQATSVMTKIVRKQSIFKYEKRWRF